MTQMSDSYSTDFFTFSELSRRAEVEVKQPTPSLHNVMRFDISLGGIGLMIDEGEVDLGQLAKSVRKAIIRAVNPIVEWEPQSVDVRQGETLHAEVITYDLT